ncbi:MAG: transposase [Candidatus Aminicenantes bacterium]|nr:transposase [Candidatus Aminicenantes bacterium]
MDKDKRKILILRQCDLLCLCRSLYYYHFKESNAANNFYLMRLIFGKYMQCPFYGSKQMTEWLKKEGYFLNRKQVSILMPYMGIDAIYPRKKLVLSTKISAYLFTLFKVMRICRFNNVFFKGIA